MRTKVVLNIIVLVITQNAKQVTQNVKGFTGSVYVDLTQLLPNIPFIYNVMNVYVVDKGQKKKRNKNPMLTVCELSWQNEMFEEPFGKGDSCNVLAIIQWNK